MPKNKRKGGKIKNEKRKRATKVNAIDFKGSSQEYGQAVRVLGKGRCEVIMCNYINERNLSY